MLEQERLCGDGTYTTRAEQLREGAQQVDGEGEKVAHGVNRTMVASAFRIAPASAGMESRSARNARRAERDDDKQPLA